MDAHPLAKKGLECGEFYILHESPWKDELQKINSIHSQYDSSYWSEIKHYILVFRESVLECLSRGFDVERSELEFDQVVEQYVKKIHVVPS